MIPSNDQPAGGFRGSGILRGLWSAHTATVQRTILSVLSLAFLARSYRFVYRNCILPPVFDFWNWVADFHLWVEHRFTFHDLIKAHANHRLVTTRLVLLADSLAFDMNGRAVVALNLAMLAATGCLLWWLARPDGAARKSWEYPPLFWIAMMSSICQVENILMPFQIGHSIMCVAACAATIVLMKAAVAQGPRALRLVILAAVLELIAAYSLGGGMLLAPALLLMLVALRARLWMSLIFGFIAAIGAALYFYHISPAEFQVASPLDMTLLAQRLEFILNLIGSDLSAFPLLARATAILTSGIFLAIVLIVALRFRRGRPVSARDAALIAIGIFVILCAIAGSASNRLQIRDASLVPRYATLSLLFVAALLGLVLRRAAQWPAPAAFHRFVPAALAVLILVGFNLQLYETDAAMMRQKATRDADYGANNLGVVWLMSMPSSGKLDELWPELAFLHRQSLNLFSPENGPPAALMGRLKTIDPATLPSCRGFIDSATMIDSTAFVTKGWVASAGGDRSAGWIVATDDDNALLGTASQPIGRPDVEKSLGIADAHGFETGFRFRRSPADDDKNGFRLFGLFPAEHDQICRLSDRGLLDPLLVVPVDKLTAVSPIPIDVPAGLEGLQTNPVDAPRPKVDVFGGSPIWRFVPGTLGAAADIKIKPARPIDVGRSVAIPFAMLAEDTRQYVVVTMADGFRLDKQFPSLWMEPAWRAVVVPADLLVHHGGLSTIEIHAAGTGWFAFAAPMQVTVPPEWSRVF